MFSEQEIIDKTLDQILEILDYPNLSPEDLEKIYLKICSQIHKAEFDIENRKDKDIIYNQINKGLSKIASHPSTSWDLMSELAGEHPDEILTNLMFKLYLSIDYQASFDLTDYAVASLLYSPKCDENTYRLLLKSRTGNLGFIKQSFLRTWNHLYGGLRLKQHGGLPII